MEDNVNPPEGTIDAAVQALLNKSTPVETKEIEAEEAPEEDNLESVETEDDTEAEDTAEEAEDSEDTEDDTEPQKFTVKIDGKDVEVTLDEALAGYMKDQDYRNKTAKVAEDRKLIESEKAKVADLAKVRESYLTESQTLQGIISTFIIPDAKLNEILQTKGAEAYLQAKNSNEKIQQQITALKTKDASVQIELTQEQKQAIADRENTEREALITAIPEFKDKAYTDGFLKYVSSMGYTQEDIANTLDHRIFIMADKARRFDEMVAKGKEKPVNKVPKVLKGKEQRKSGSEIQSQKLKELQSKARNTGSKNDHVALLLAKNNGA